MLDCCKVLVDYEYCLAETISILKTSGEHSYSSIVTIRLELPKHIKALVRKHKSENNWTIIEWAIFPCPLCISAQLHQHNMPNILSSDFPWLDCGWFGISRIGMVYARLGRNLFISGFEAGIFLVIFRWRRIVMQGTEFLRAMYFGAKNSTFRLAINKLKIMSVLMYIQTEF